MYNMAEANLIACCRPEVVMSLPVKRRSLFRAVNAVNNEYDPAFPASQYNDGGDGAFVR